MKQCGRLYRHASHTFNEVGVVENQTGYCPGLGRIGAIVAHVKWMRDGIRGSSCPQCKVRPMKAHKAGCPTGAWDGGTWA